MKKLLQILAGLAAFSALFTVYGYGAPQNVQKDGGALTAGFTVPTGTSIAPTGSGTIAATTSALAASVNGGTAQSLTGWSLRSTGAAFDLSFSTSEVLTGNRNVTWNVGNAARAVTLSGNPTLADWFDQSVKAAASPSFAGITSLGTALSVPNGGTGAATLTSNAILKGNGTGAVQSADLTSSTTANVTTVSSTTGNEVKIQTLDGNKPVTIAPNGTGAVNINQGLDVEWTGTPMFPILLMGAGVSQSTFIPATSGTRSTLTAYPGVSLVNFNYTENGIKVPGLGLQTIKFWNLVQTSNFSFGSTILTSISAPALVQTQDFSFNSSPLLTTVDFPVLTFIAGNFAPATCNTLTTLSFPELLGIKQTFQPNNFPLVTTWSFPKFIYCTGSFNPNTMAALTSMTMPELLYCGQWSPNTMASLTTLTCAKLATIGGSFLPSTMASLTTINLPEVLIIGSGDGVTGGANAGNFAPTTMAALTTLTLPKLVTIHGTFAPTTMASLTTLSYPLLTTIDGAVSASSMAALTTINLPAMITYGSTITFTSSLGAVSTVTLGTIGTLKTVSGATVTFSGQALNQASVDGVLKLLASLDGTGGTTSFGTGKTVTLTGGTNASPTTSGTTATTPAGSSFVGVGTTCTATITTHGLSSGDIITTTGIATLTNANVTAATVTVLNANQFTFTIVSQTATGTGTASMHSTPAAGTDGFHACQVIRLRGATVTTALGF